MKRLGLALVLIVAFATVVDAYLPSSIETTLRGFFNSASRLVQLKFYERGQPAASTSGNCVWYMDSTSHALKVSCNGGSYSFIAGAGTTTAGCSFTGTTLVCPAFDSPAQAASGGCLTLKEGSNNGTSTIQECAPADVSVSRVNTYNTDGTRKASDIETAVANENGRDAMFSATTGALIGRTNPLIVYLPDGSPAMDPGGGETAVLSANGMRCVTITARDGIVGATSLAAYVSTLGGTCSPCLYNDGDAGTLIAPLTSGVASTASDCTSTGAKTLSSLDAFTIVRGTRYRLCTTSSSNLTKWFKGPYYANVVANMVSTTAGTAASTGTSGKCPATTGALTPVDVNPPIVRVN